MKLKDTDKIMLRLNDFWYSSFGQEQNDFSLAIQECMKIIEDAPFREYGVEMLVPYGRMRFIQKDGGIKNSPNFQSVYVCNKLLEDQIVFSDAVFGKE